LTDIGILINGMKSPQGEEEENRTKNYADTRLGSLRVKRNGAAGFSLRHPLTAIWYKYKILRCSQDDKMAFSQRSQRGIRQVS
jgi:hypothetical protein